MSDIRLVIKDELERRGFSQAAIAKKAGLKPQQLNDIVHLRRKMEANEMLAICDAMEISYGSLRPDHPN